VEASITHLNPDGLHKNPAYSQAVVVAGPAKTVYVGGQNAVDAHGNVVGKGDIKAQSAQAIRNIEAAVVAAGGSLEHVIKWTVYLVEGQPFQPGFEAFVEAWPVGSEPPIVTAAVVSALAAPDFLVEIDAIAVIPGE
jgi:enamine deaminase RidA (YjgF/YER057c/UK114 family)